MAIDLSFLLPVLAFSLFAFARTRTYLHYFQQEEYDNQRFLQWWLVKRVFDRRLTLGLIVLSIGQIWWPSTWVWYVALAALMLVVAVWEKNPTKSGKKRLVFTARAKRIFVLAWLVSAAFGVLSLRFSALWFWLIPVQLMPLFLVLSNLCWSPYEKNVQRFYWRDAKNKLEQISPFIIGITGSFGKTSVKHILGHVLETVAPTLWTPGSVNTVMGNARIIREKLTPQHKYFIVEMGAYGPGSIERLCELTAPDMAIITAIGQAHYERFKTLETVAKAKFELAQAVIANNPKGQVITHAEVVQFAPAKQFASEHPQNMVFCDQDLLVEQTQTGLTVQINWKGQDYKLFAPLFGLHHGKNIALAFIAACSLGIAPEMVVTALKSTPQIRHRLEVKSQADGILIDDAFNSNPQGFISALSLLEQLGEQRGSRRILVTPGMVELGSAHDEQHTKLAKLAVQCTDIVLAICPQRIRAFVETYSAHKQDEQQLIPCASFAAAQAWLAQYRQNNDIVLLENDMPDLYEGLPSI